MERTMHGECRVRRVVVESTAELGRIPDFHRLLGDAAWLRLPLAVRERFAAHSHITPTFYRGAMQVNASLLGRCFAHVCRLIGTPVTAFVGTSVPVEVRVQDLADRSGTIWERCYRFPGHDPTIVRSIKQLDDDGTLVEKLGAGLHMKLDVRELDGELHFLSTGYFFRLGSLRVDLPRLFPPGMTRVAHIDKGHGRFQFVMRTAHPWFGEMFVQDGEFE
jgi:hypothetical protein